MASILSYLRTFSRFDREKVSTSICLAGGLSSCPIGSSTTSCYLSGVHLVHWRMSRELLNRVSVPLLPNPYYFLKPGIPCYIIVELESCRGTYRIGVQHGCRGGSPSR